MSPAFEAGIEACKSGKTENDNPFIIGKTKLGNNKLSEDGIEWLNGFVSAIKRVATQKEMQVAAQYDVSRFRRKSNRYYGK